MTAQHPDNQLLETLCDMAFDFGYEWARINTETCAQIMDAMGGSRELNEMIRTWAVECEAEYQQRLAADEDYEYMDHQIVWFTQRFAEWKAQVIATKLTQ